MREEFDVTIAIAPPAARSAWSSSIAPGAGATAPTPASSWRSMMAEAPSESALASALSVSALSALAERPPPAGGGRSARASTARAASPPAQRRARNASYSTRLPRGNSSNSAWATPCAASQACSSRRLPAQSTAGSSGASVLSKSNIQSAWPATTRRRDAPLPWVAAAASAESRRDASYLPESRRDASLMTPPPRRRSALHRRRQRRR